MKNKILNAALAALIALAALPALAQTQVTSPQRIVIQTELTVAAGAVINSAVLDTSSVTQIVALVDNSAAAGARNFSFKCYAKDKTTVLFTSADLAVSNAAPGNAYALIDARASSASAATRETVYPMRPCRFMSFHLAAAGAAAATLAVYGYGP